MKYKQIPFRDIQSFRLGKQTSSIESYWEEVYRKMPKELQDFYHKVVCDNTSIIDIDLEYAAHVKDTFGDAVPYTFTIKKHDTNATQLNMLQDYLKTYILVVNWL